MKLLIIITIFFVFQSCQAKNYDSEIKKAFETKKIKKIEKILDEYYQINGTDFLLEKSYIELNILKKDFKRVFELYQNTQFIKIKKDKKIITEISNFIIDSNKKLEPVKRIKYYKTALKAFPYSEEIYNEYISTLLSLNEISESFRVYLKYDEIFNKTNKYLNKIIFAKLKSIYLKDKSFKTLRLITKIDKTIKFLESEIQKSPKILLNLESLPKDFNTQILKYLIPNKNYSISKVATKFFILLEKKQESETYIKRLYNSSSDGLKILIYNVYYAKYNEEIDNKLIDKLLKSNNQFEIKAAVQIIKNNKITKYTEKVKKLLGKEKYFNLDKKYLLEALSELDREYLKSFILNQETMKSSKIKQQLKKQQLILDFGIKNNCEQCEEALSNKDLEETFKVIALRSQILNKKDISFFKEYNNFIYYLIFLENSKLLDKKLMKNLAISAYNNWKDSRMLSKYLKSLTLSEINKLYSEKTFKELKDQYYLTLIYYSVTLDENVDKFKNFILTKRFSKESDIDLFKFSKNHLNILVKLYILENKINIKNKILEKIVDILEN